MHADLDLGRSPLLTVVPDEELAALRLIRHDFHGEWSYTIELRTNHR